MPKWVFSLHALAVASRLVLFYHLLTWRITIGTADERYNGRNARLELRRQPTAKKLHHVTSGDSRGRRLTT